MKVYYKVKRSENRSLKIDIFSGFIYFFIYIDTTERLRINYLGLSRSNLKGAEA